MAQCRFEFAISGDSQRVVDQVRSHVGQAGGRFDGSAGSGTFSLPTPIGAFEGTWSVVGQSIVIEVTTKPFFVPCSAIESRLADYVRDVG